ncbi:Chorismate mutase I [Oxalobacteraceae bacterium IMCC9480]|nr:Chorismate mutase I [Oxalobacteraceae bacterium IMCC9480]
MPICIIGGGLAAHAAAAKILIENPKANVVILNDGGPSNSSLAGQRYRTRAGDSQKSDQDSFVELLASRNGGQETKPMRQFARTSIAQIKFWQTLEPRKLGVDLPSLASTDKPEWFGPQFGTTNAVGNGHGRSTTNWFKKLARELGATTMEGSVTSLNRELNIIESVNAQTKDGQQMNIAAEHFVLAGGSVGGRMFESTNIEIQNSPQELAWEAGLGLVDATKFMFHIMGNVGKDGSSKPGCLETDKLDQAKVYLPIKAGSDLEELDKYTTDLLSNHKAHYEFPEIARRFISKGGKCRISMPDGTSLPAQVAHHYSHLGVETDNGIAVTGVSNLSAIGDASGTGFWSGNKVRFPGTALDNCLVGAAMIAKQSPGAWSDPVVIKPIAEQSIPLNRNTAQRAKLLRQINTQHLFDIEFGDQPRQAASNWVETLEATQFDSTIAQISLATARSCFAEQSGLPVPKVIRKDQIQTMKMPVAARSRIEFSQEPIMTMTSSSKTPKELVDLRVRIDKMDSVLISHLAERFRFTEQVGYVKAGSGFLPIDNTREQAQARRIAELAEQEGLNPIFAQKLLKLIIGQVVKRHKEIAAEPLNTKANILSPRDELLKLRVLIDESDAKLIKYLAERFDLTEQVGQLKAKKSISATDKSRETAQAERISAIAKQEGIDAPFAQEFLTAIIAEVTKRHQQIAATSEKNGGLDSGNS